MSKIVITGSGSGLGKEAAQALAKRGHKVYACVEYDEQIHFFNEYNKNYNTDIVPIKLNILNEEDRNKLKDIEFNVLINNAAIGDSGSIAEIDVQRIKDVFEINVFANIRVTQIAIQKFIEKKCGRVIFVSSLAGRVAYPFLSPYSASKSALEAFATSLRFELKLLKNIKIQVGIIEPGAYATGFNHINSSKKYEWMNKKSYFKEIIADIAKYDNMFWKIIEKKKFDSIIKKYIRAVEDVKVKHRYTAPKLQAFFTQVGRIFGI